MKNQNKEELIELARKGLPRPSRTEPLGIALHNYYYPSSRSYDPIFAEELKSLAPVSWWKKGKHPVNAEDKKAFYLEKAKEGSPLTLDEKKKLWRLLWNMRTKSFDPIFEKLIKCLAPEWFKKELANLKKEELLRLAKSGAPRPSVQTKLGRSLSDYVCRTSNGYDHVFTATIKKLVPHWFKKEPL